MFSAPSLVGSAILFVGLAYFLYVPLNDGIEDRGIVRGLIIFSKLMKYVGAVSEAVGWDSSVNLTKKITTLLLANGLPQMEGITSEDYIFDGTPVRLYRPESPHSSKSTPSPCVIYVHGGGWTVLNVDIYDEFVGELALKTGYVFISIEYRLAPENPYPIPLEDCYRAIMYLLDHTEDYNIDLDRLAIAGDSAGGNLVAALTLKLREDPDVPPFRFQWLIYPVLQAFDYSLPSYISNYHAAPYFLQPPDIIHYWCNYMGIKSTPDIIHLFLNNQHTSSAMRRKYSKLVDHKLLPSEYHGVVSENTDASGDKTGEDTDLIQKLEKLIFDPHFAPLMSFNLSGLPPTFVLTAEYDILRDDGLIYAERMRRDGVEVEVFNELHSIHGFMMWTAFIPKYTYHEKAVQRFITFAKTHM